MICSALKADNLPMPKFTVNPDDIMIKFTGTEDRIVRVNDCLREEELELLNYLYRDPGYTVTQLSELIWVSRKTVAGYTKNLKEKNIIERVGSDRKGYWKIVE